MADVAFIGLSVLTVGSAIFALESREIVYGAIALAISMLGIAGFFILLDSPFVAMFQIIVYVGAVAVLVIFIVIIGKQIYKYCTQHYNIYAVEDEFRTNNYGNFWSKLTIPLQ